MTLTSSPYRVSLVVVSPTLAVVNHLSWWCFLPFPLVVCCHNGTPLQYFCLENPMTEEPGRLQSMGSLGLDTTEQLHFDFSLSCIGEGNGSPLQCSSLENPRDREAWWAAIYGVAPSRTRLKWLSSSSMQFWLPQHSHIHTMVVSSSLAYLSTIPKQVL